MKSKVIFIGILLLILFVFCIKAQQDDFPVLKGPYLGQKPQGTKPEIFAPGIISTGISESCPAFTPDGRYLFLSSSRKTHNSYSGKPITYEKKIMILNSPGNGNTDIYWVDAKIIENFRHYSQNKEELK